MVEHSPPHLKVKGLGLVEREKITNFFITSGFRKKFVINFVDCQPEFLISDCIVGSDVGWYSHIFL